MRELEIKRELVKYLIEGSTIDAISIEFPFHFGRRRADLICLQGNITTGFEIKSAYDRIDGLAEQLISYAKIFDFVYVVCDEKNLKKIRSRIPTRIGILTCSATGIIKIRSARQIKTLDSIATLDAMPIESLRKTFRYSAASKIELCEKIKKEITKEEIKIAFTNYIANRFGAQTSLFQRETTSSITLDDVFSLGLTTKNLDR